MYNNDQLRQTFRRITIGVIVLMVVIAVWFILTHGFVTADSSKQTPLTYVKLSDSLNEPTDSTASKRVLLPSGQYSFGIPLQDGNIFVSQTEVPRILTASELTAKGSAPLVKTLGRNAFAQLIRTPAGLASHQADTFRPIDPTNITNDNLGDTTDSAYPHFIQSVTVSARLIGGITTTDAGFQPLIYDTITKQARSLPLITDVAPEKIYLKAENGLLSAFNSGSGEVYVYSGDDTTTLALSHTDKISNREGRPIYSASAKRVALTTGADLVGSNDNESETEKSSQTVKVFDTTSRQNLWERTFSHSPVLRVNLSPDGRRVAVQTATATAIYNITDDTVAFTIPFSTTDFAWVDNDRFVFISQSDGIFSGSLKSKTARTFVSYEDIRPTALSFIEDDKVYFTGYSGADENTQQPAAFLADLTRKASKQSTAALRKFPHQGRGYYVDLLDNLVTIQTTRYIEQAPQQADEFSTPPAVSPDDATIDTQAQAEGLKYATDALGGSLAGYTPRYTYADLQF